MVGNIVGSSIRSSSTEKESVDTKGHDYHSAAGTFVGVAKDNYEPSVNSATTSVSKLGATSNTDSNTDATRNIASFSDKEKPKAEKAIEDYESVANKNGPTSLNNFSADQMDFFKNLYGQNKNEAEDKINRIIASTKSELYSELLKLSAYLNENGHF